MSNALVTEARRRADAAGLGRPARLILEKLAVMADDHGELRRPVPDSQLTKLTGYKRTAVKAARRELVAAGLVDVVPGHGVKGNRDANHASRYRVTLAPQLVENRPQSEPTRVDPRPTVGQSATHGGSICDPPPHDSRLVYARAHHALRGPRPPEAAAARERARERRPQLVELDGKRQGLAQELWRRHLRASCNLSPGELELVDAVIDRVGVHRMVQAAYDAHRPRDPARSWRAWLDLWAGLQPPPLPATGTRPLSAALAVPSVDPDNVRDYLAAIRAAGGGGS